MTPRNRFELAALALLTGLPALAAPQQAPLAITQAAPFLRLDPPPEAWQHSPASDSRDWRVLDAHGQRVPFALLPAAPALAAAPAPSPRELRPFPLPPVPAAASASVPASHEPAGWLLDLGEPAGWPGEPSHLQLRWPASAPVFQAGYRLETGSDLQRWQPLSTGQLLGLTAADEAPLSQPLVALPARPARYLRLVWDDPARAVRPDGVTLLTRTAAAANPEPVQTRSQTLGPLDADGSWRVDLGSPQQLRSVQLAGEAGTWVLPLQLQARNGPQAPWQPLSRTLFYRVDRGAGPADEAMPLALAAEARELRLLPPMGAALPPPGSLRLRWTLQLPRLVWAAQGTPPYRLEVGSTAADAGPRPLAEVVPDWAGEQARLGRSTLGAFTALPAPPKPVNRRPWLLWGVLVLGVLGLGAAAWRLWRQGPQDGST